ncbi:hypothetical protein CANARDRAFT_26379 [[Candida] arabinofermentans NRRL YB-2248]|uniref:t-SNARE coiled-coil homology domain-containing protein n=1 Tax=[Candida] arabinofermentans NRRL YB-2248 TaxID=983967 RepID=A0A1E4T8X5_9ASCO|nr:hypothetical protein CANARDRAFT_26379 [[Candida] arabinofermentans NRRL YB-2248]
MTDLTPFFNKCVSIYESELSMVGGNSQPGKVTHASATQSKLTSNNSFILDSIKLNKSINDLGTLIYEIQTDYLLYNSKNLSELEKDKIDSTFKLQLQIINKRLSQLTTYAQNLNEALTSQGSIEDIGKNLLTMGDYGQYVAILNSSIIEIRSNIIKSLGLRITAISNHFVEINAKRQARKKELSKSTLNTNTYYSYTPAETLGSSNMSLNDSQLSSNNVALEESKHGEVSEEYEQMNTNLDQQQLQQLSKENENILLEIKNSHLESLNQIENSMVEISSVINEINLQLNLQNDSITILADSQDDILGNMDLGNRQLVKANEKAKNAGKNMSYMIIGLGIFLLLVDYML